MPRDGSAAWASVHECSPLVRSSFCFEATARDETYVRDGGSHESAGNLRRGALARHLVTPRLGPSEADESSHPSNAIRVPPGEHAWGTKFNVGSRMVAPI